VTRATGPQVEILSVAGCPNAEPARALVERVSRELGIASRIRLFEVTAPEEARRLRFPGSPTVRVEGRDVDPHTAEDGEYALACRVFRTDAGLAGQPDERWVRAALLEAAVAAER
jgi:hypothetical protein